MEDIFGRDLDLNSGQEPFGSEEENTPDTEDFGRNPNSGGINSDEDGTLKTSLPEIEVEKKGENKISEGVEGSHNSLMGFQPIEGTVLEHVKPSDFPNKLLVEPSGTAVRETKYGICPDLNEISVEPVEKPAPIEVCKPAEAGIAEGLTHKTDDRLGEVQFGRPLQTMENQFGAVEAKVVSGVTVTDRENLGDPSNSMENPSGLPENVNSMEGPSSLQKNANLMEDPSGLQETLNPMKDSSDLQERMERCTERSISAQDTKRYEGEKSSFIPSNEEHEKHRFSVGDLVWGKVKYHPWWPGQVFDPLDSSDFARKRQKKGRLLVAYFGDQTFAWCEESQLKPFQQNYKEMAKQSTAKPFCNAVKNALDELARRVEFGLTCSCLSKQTHSRLGSKATINTGIREGAVFNNHREVSLVVTALEPRKLLAYVRDLAESPFTSGTLEITMARAQVSAFFAAERLLVYGTTCAETPIKHGTAYEAKPVATSPVSSQHGQALGAFESGTKLLKNNDRSSGKRRESSYRKQLPKNRKRRIGDLNVEYVAAPGPADGMGEHDEAFLEICGSRTHVLKDMTGTPKKIRQKKGEEISPRKCFLSIEKKPRRTESIFHSGGYKNDLKGMKGKKDMNYTSPRGGDGKELKIPKAFKLGECIRRIASQLTGSPPIIRSGNHAVQKKTYKDSGKKGKVKSKRNILKSPLNKLKTTWSVREDFSVKELLLELSLVAQNPMYYPEEEHIFSRVSSVFLEFRDAVFQKDSSYRSCKKASALKLVNRRAKQKSSKCSSKLIGPFSINDSEELDCTDKTGSPSPRSYRLERTLKRKAELQVENTKKQSKCCIKSRSPTQLNMSFKKNLEEDTGDRDVNQYTRKSAVPVSPAINVTNYPHERNAIPSPTALFMRFPSGFALPSETELKEKFVHYGPLEVTETEVFSNSGCAQVVFKRRCDAEAAFNGATQNSVFGPATVSFRLRYLSSRIKTDTPQSAEHGKDERNMPYEDRQPSLIEDASKGVEELKENVVQPCAENFGTSRANPSGEPSLLLNQQIISKVDDVALVLKANIEPEMMGLLQTHAKYVKFLGFTLPVYKECTHFLRILNTFTNIFERCGEEKFGMLAEIACQVDKVFTWALHM
eukprot:Gb_11632 [translate_table: standard]